MKIEDRISQWRDNLVGVDPHVALRKAHTLLCDAENELRQLRSKLAETKQRRWMT